ncbi:TPA_asm: coat protein [ssRNA phage SRR5466725_19]|uniref:Coat protein n=1 Tax=ssRNA phage SRR5466725_19 TaxID=2786417 RepID=A0A8S5L3V1_9VIRU|nr:coat protein [ssRNA phage SRR5466725_19]DAD52430.1 TPA_asm: coat protein [ssRNA phage SRR5466725_19]
MAITLNSKTYNFIGFDRNGTSVYQETSGGFPTSFSYLTCRVFPSSAKGPAKVRWRLTMPVVAPADTGFTQAGTILRTFTYDEGRIDVPGDSASAERTDFSARITGLAANAQYLASITALTQPSS